MLLFHFVYLEEHACLLVLMQGPQIFQLQFEKRYLFKVKGKMKYCLEAWELLSCHIEMAIVIKS